MLINKKNSIIVSLCVLLISCGEKAEHNVVAKNDKVDDMIIAGMLFLAGMILFYLSTKIIVNAMKGRRQRGIKRREADIADNGFALNAEENAKVLQLQNKVEELNKKLQACEQNNRNIESKKEDPAKDFSEMTVQDLLVEEQLAPVLTLSVEPLNTGPEVKMRYSKFADENAMFPHTHLLNSDDGSCYYKLEIDEINNTAKFEPITAGISLSSFKNNKNMLLLPYCDLNNYFETWSGIKVIEKGWLKYADTGWIVEKKCKIELI
ncbi:MULTISPECIES: hypothetical protein [unclassified Kaistella]|uniref:hypothetical protein n=1 Tax=unclassified Kaistella TaxID=2762626 RepID=UPI002736F346|nr:MULTISPECIES: hypothetical protein [unclassified Kaistella]MDP2455143.1 hypothetical protein [Kaistella sp. SH11-4b]MDP2458050.1 hypothetical protein [Kaistella sp. SH40-3]MDP2461017.1 hypothetical protein [Kaistella sp. SH19-2b]